MSVFWQLDAEISPTTLFLCALKPEIILGPFRIPRLQGWLGTHFHQIIGRHGGQSLNIPVSGWCGIDVSKRTIDVAFLPLSLFRQCEGKPDFKKIPTQSFSRSQGGVLAMVSWLDDQAHSFRCHNNYGVVMEATGRYSQEFAIWIKEARPEYRVAICNPYATSSFHKSLNLRSKTDALDALALAWFGCERRPASTEIQDPARDELRQLVRLREQFVKEAAVLRSQLEEPLVARTVAKHRRKRLKQLDKSIKDIEKDIATLVKEDPNLARDVALLCTIPGVAETTAILVLAELGDLRRFGNGRKIAAAAGLCPREFRSGSSINRRTRLSKAGNRCVRRGLYLPAIVAARWNPILRMTYSRLIDAGKPKRAAIGVIMRKLLVLMRSILVYQRPFDPDFLPA